MCLTRTLAHQKGAPSGAPLLRLQICKHNKGETYINFCKGVIEVSFSTMLELLQEKNNQRVVLIKTGIFYIATGKDAIFLNKVLKLKCTCFSENVCKVGIPETSLPKYLERLDRLNVSYIVYLFNNEKEMLVEECRNDGEYHKEKRPNQNCLLCSGLRRYSEDKYMNAFRKMLEQELKGCE